MLITDCVLKFLLPLQFRHMNIGFAELTKTSKSKMVHVIWMIKSRCGTRARRASRRAAPPVQLLELHLPGNLLLATFLVAAAAARAAAGRLALASLQPARLGQPGIKAVAVAGAGTAAAAGGAVHAIQAVRQGCQVFLAQGIASDVNIEENSNVNTAPQQGAACHLGNCDHAVSLWFSCFETSDGPESGPSYRLHPWYSGHLQHSRTSGVKLQRGQWISGFVMEYAVQRPTDPRRCYQQAGMQHAVHL